MLLPVSSPQTSLAHVKTKPQTHCSATHLTCAGQNVYMAKTNNMYVQAHGPTCPWQQTGIPTSNTLADRATGLLQSASPIGMPATDVPV